MSEVIKAIKCELCGSNELVKQDNYFVCQFCGTKYTPEAAKKLIIDITSPISVTGTVQTTFGNAEKDRLIKNAKMHYELKDYGKCKILYRQITEQFPCDGYCWWEYYKIAMNDYISDSLNDELNFRFEENNPYNLPEFNAIDNLEKIYSNAKYTWNEKSEIEEKYEELWKKVPFYEVRKPCNREIAKLNAEKVNRFIWNCFRQASEVKSFFKKNESLKALKFHESFWHSFAKSITRDKYEAEKLFNNFILFGDFSYRPEAYCPKIDVSAYNEKTIFLSVSQYRGKVFRCNITSEIKNVDELIFQIEQHLI